jgi:hypothetical protein
MVDDLLPSKRPMKLPPSDPKPSERANKPRNVMAYTVNEVLKGSGNASLKNYVYNSSQQKCNGKKKYYYYIYELLKQTLKTPDKFSQTSKYTKIIYN